MRKRKKHAFQWKNGLMCGVQLLERQLKWMTFQCGFNTIQKCFSTLSTDQVRLLSTSTSLCRINIDFLLGFKKRLKWISYIFEFHCFIDFKMQNGACQNEISSGISDMVYHIQYSCKVSKRLNTQLKTHQRRKFKFWRRWLVSAGQADRCTRGSARTYASL